MSESYIQRTYEKGDVIFREGDPAHEAFMIKEGLVKLVVRKDGEPKTIDVIGQKKIFGEMAVLSGKNRMAAAIAEEETVCIAVQRRILERKLEELPDQSRDLMMFLIAYSQDLLPVDLRDRIPADEATLKRHTRARDYVWDARRKPLDGGDNFMNGFYQALVGYAIRRLPLGMRP